MNLAEEDDLDEDVVKDTWEALEGELDDKIETYCKVIKNLEGDVKALAAEIARFNEKKSKIENTITRMKQTMFNSMKTFGCENAGGQFLKASIRKNGGRLPLIMSDITAENLPDEFRNVIYEPDKGAIYAALDAGRKLDFAHYGERGEHLRII